MGVDIELKGSFPRAGLLSGFFPAAGLRKYVKQTTAWLDERFAGLPIEYEVAKDEDGKPLILLGLHPAAEEVRLQFDGDHHVLATARTNTAGPGYHAFVCKMLHEFAEAQKLTWLSPEGDTPGDETGYFESGDRAKLDEHMLGWLSTLATHLRDLLEKEDLEDLRICMTAGSRCNYLHGRPITTHMGPRDRDWVKRVAANPRDGLDLFPWWSEETFGAEARLGWALAKMWTEVRWRSPETEEEGNLNEELLEMLREAHKLNPDLGYPWKEWAELLESAERDDDLAKEVRCKAAEEPEREAIGYRRFEVVQQITESWSLKIPGSFAEEVTDQGWIGWEGGRTLRVTAFSASESLEEAGLIEKMLESGRAERPEGEELRHQTEKWRAAGHLTKERGPRTETGPDEDYQCLTTMNVAGNRAAIVTITFAEPSDREWAIDTWHSLQHIDQHPEEEVQISGP